MIGRPQFISQECWNTPRGIKIPIEITIEFSIMDLSVEISLIEISMHVRQLSDLWLHSDSLNGFTTKCSYASKSKEVLVNALLVNALLVNALFVNALLVNALLVNALLINALDNLFWQAGRSGYQIHQIDNLFPRTRIPEISDAERTGCDDIVHTFRNVQQSSLGHPEG